MIKDSNRKWWVLFTTCLLAVMLNFDATAVNLAIPVIAREFQASLVDMEWVINAFILFSAMFQIVGGRAGDLWGHRRLFIIGTVIFVVSSMIAGISQSEVILISARASQGFALGIAYPMTIALIYDVFPREQHGLAIGLSTGAMGLSLAIGPTLGGIILHYIGWRWIFWANVPVGVAIILLAYITCPSDRPKHGEKLDYSGAVLLVLGLFGVVLALNQSQTWGADSLKFILTMGSGLLALMVLFFVEKNKKAPIIDFKLFLIRNYLLHSIIRVVAEWVFIPILFLIAIYLQNISGYEPLIVSLLMLCLTLVVGLLSPIAGKSIDWIGIKIPTIIALIAFAIGCFLLYFLKPEPNLFLLTSALIFIGIGTGISLISTTTGALSPRSPKESGEATGVFMTIAWVSPALGVSLAGIILTFSGQHWLQDQLIQRGIFLNPLQLDKLLKMAQGMSLPITAPSHISHKAVELTDLASSAFMHGFHVVMLVLMALSIFTLPLTFLLVKEKR